MDHTFSVQNISTSIKAVKTTKYTVEFLYQQTIENENVKKEKEIVDQSSKQIITEEQDSEEKEKQMFLIMRIQNPLNKVPH